MAWYASRREAILAGEDLTPQNREEAVLMGLAEPMNEKEVKLLESIKKRPVKIKVETTPTDEIIEEAPKPKAKKKAKKESE